jgi:GNAT superfamily N-acetyltransferase
MNLSFRPYEGPDDCVAMLRIRQESAVVDHVDPISTCESVPTLENIKQSVDRPDVRDRFLLMTLGAEIIGYAQMTWWTEADGTSVYVHNDWVRPDHRSDDIPRRLLARVQQHLAGLAQRHGTATQAAFGANASETEPDRADLLLADGYERVWTMVEMEFTDFNSMEVPPTPAGITIAAPRSEDYRAIWEANVAVYAGTWGIMPADEDNFEDFKDSFESPELCDVAWDGSHVAGFVLSAVRNGVGVVGEVTTAKTYQRRGIGRALLTRNLAKFPPLGIHTVRLHTDADNGTGGRGLYEKIGFRPVRLYMRYRKAFSV